MDEPAYQMKSIPISQHEDKESAAIIYSGHWMISDVNGYESDDEASSSTATAPSSPISSPENLLNQQINNLINPMESISGLNEQLSTQLMETDVAQFDNQEVYYQPPNHSSDLTRKLSNTKETQAHKTHIVNEQLRRSDSNSTIRQGNLIADEKHIQSYSIRTKNFLSIDKNLSRLFKCMTLAYTEKPASPRWNWFRGLKLQLKDKLRLNNLIWRAWHMQFIFHVNPPVCQFDVSLEESIPQMIILEGSYWKRRLDTVTAEYRKWRVTMKERLVWQHKLYGSPKRTFKLNHKLPNILKSSSAFYHQNHGPVHARPRLASPLTAMHKCASPSLMGGGDPTGQSTWNLERYPTTGNNILAGSKDLLDSLCEDNWNDPFAQLLNNNYYPNNNATPPAPPSSYLDALSSTNYEDIFDDALFSNLFGPPSVGGTEGFGFAPYATPQSQTAPLASSQQPEIYRCNDEYFNVYGRSTGLNDGRPESLCVPWPDPKKLLAARRQDDPGSTFDSTVDRAGDYLNRLERDQQATTTTTPVTKRSRVSYCPSHLVQPGLGQLQPNVESYMETLGSLEEILETTKRSYRHIYGPFQDDDVSSPSSAPHPLVQAHPNTTTTTTLAVNSLSSYFTSLQPATTKAQQPSSTGGSPKKCAGKTVKSVKYGKRRSQPKTLLPTTVFPSSSNLTSATTAPKSGHTPPPYIIYIVSASYEERTDARGGNSNFGVTLSTRGFPSHRSLDESSDNDSGCVPESRNTPLSLPSPYRGLQNATPNLDLTAFGLNPSASYLTLHLPSTSTTTSGKTKVSTTPVYRKIAPAPSIQSNFAFGPFWSVDQKLTAPPALRLDLETQAIAGARYPSTNNRSSSFSAPASNGPVSTIATTLQDSDVVKTTNIRTNSISRSESGHNIRPPFEKSHSDADYSILRRRSGHINAEHKRRFHIKSGFDSLCSSIPSLCNSSGQKASKVAILSHASVYIKHMRRKVTDSEANIRALTLTIATLNREISYYQNAMPNPRPAQTDLGLEASLEALARRDYSALSFAQFLKMDKALCAQNYATYVKGKCILNWRYYLFSLLTHDLFETYNEFVSTASLEELCSNVLSWLNQFCSLQIMRPIVTKVIVSLSKKTSILLDPTKFSEELIKLSQSNENAL